MTNREWLNSMSDEELLDFMFERGVGTVGDEDVVDAICRRQNPPCDKFNSCYECQLDWLKKERVEDERKMFKL